MFMANLRRSDPAGEVRRLYEETESATAQAFEQAVLRRSVGELLARMAENAAAMAKSAATYSTCCCATYAWRVARM
jgi:hypothetical protein